MDTQPCLKSERAMEKGLLYLYEFFVLLGTSLGAISPFVCKRCVLILSPIYDNSCYSCALTCHVATRNTLLDLNDLCDFNHDWSRVEKHVLMC